MKLLFLASILAITYSGFSETRLTTAQYVEMWKTTAVEQMHSHKIPASITLAQGILESGSGNSRLAKEANNHFGIKCHKAWTGDTFIQDDDAKDECFRRYYSADESYTDHSLFLTGRSRYAGLFQLKLTDYKGWAKGLKAAGYATNPKYAYLLIDLIERYHLNQYDKMSSEELISVKKSRKEVEVKPVETAQTADNNTKHDRTVTNSKPNYSGNISIVEIKPVIHTVAISSNNVKYIEVKEGDTFYRIAKEFEITIAQLYKYNEFNKKDVLQVGDRIYISPKRSKGTRKNSNYVCRTNTTLRDIAHEQGMKLNSLMKLNLSENPDAILTKGTKVTLR
jgi:LysM repeat protein